MGPPRAALPQAQNSPTIGSQGPAHLKLTRTADRQEPPAQEGYKYPTVIFQ